MMSGLETHLKKDLKRDTVTVYQVEVYDIHSDQYIVSKRYATPNGAKQMNGRILFETEIRIPWQDLEESTEWTAIGYAPKST